LSTITAGETDVTEDRLRFDTRCEPPSTPARLPIHVEFDPQRDARFRWRDDGYRRRPRAGRRAAGR
jgi:hypothetical protein